MIQRTSIESRAYLFFLLLVANGHWVMPWYIYIHISILSSSSCLRPIHISLIVLLVVGIESCHDWYKNSLLYLLHSINPFIPNCVRESWRLASKNIFQSSHLKSRILEGPSHSMLLRQKQERVPLAAWCWMKKASHSKLEVEGRTWHSCPSFYCASKMFHFETTKR